ncbi:MAG: hypothetical protein QNJ32_15445 [Xenococcaceae cyanobacterium MO_167.B27]|nr:hypothetical protein [Xenococcaceae cyanobacterium MO_167.B27]
MSILKSKFYAWLILSIIVSILFSCAGLKLSFQSIYTIQDDARQHIFWMQQFSERDLFQGDLIGNYFKSVSPWGFTTLYKLVNHLGIDIFWFNKISPLLIGIATTIYCFIVCLEFIPVPLAGFFSSLLLNQNLWMVDDLSSGTPRAFIYPLLLAFIYYLLKQKTFLCVSAILLQGLFYPPAVLLSATILLINFLRKRTAKTIYLYGWLTAIIILSFYAFKTSDFGEIITVSQAKLLPEFSATGRSAFFTDSWSEFWLTARRSGLFPIEWQYSLMCSYGLLVLWLPSLPKIFPLGQKINRKLLILGDVFLASVIMFILAHVFLFRLHLPGRYTQHSIRIIIALLDGIVLSIVFNYAARKINYYFKSYHTLYKTVILILLTCLLLLPTYAVQSYPNRLGYVTGKSPQLYEFLQQQPKDSVIATISEEANFIPSFTGRSVLVAEEYGIPYHQGYYQEFSQRVQHLITAQYSVNLATITDFIRKYNINLWLLDQNAFELEYLKSNQWLMQFQPATNDAIKILQQKQQPILYQKGGELRDRCILFKKQNLILLSAKCITQ